MENFGSKIQREVDDETMTSQIKELKIWVANQTIVPELSDKTLELFLHSCFYDVTATKQTFLAYFKLRIESPYFFSDRNPRAEWVRSTATTAFSFLLPGTTDEGYKVIVSGLLPWDGRYLFKENIKRYMMQIDMWLSKLDVCAGLYIIIDSQHSNFSHYKSASFDTVKKLTTYFQEALPVRLKKIFFTNISSSTNMLMTMSQPFISKKIREMIEKYTTGDEGYLNFIPRRMLPVDFGGELGTINELNEKAQKELEDYYEWFEEQDKIIMSLMEKHALLPSKKKRSWFF